MKKYKAKVKHDTGIVNLYVYKDNEQDARKEICRLEGCPDSAILKIQLMPFYVTMTDKFMSGWGKADKKINKFIVECESYQDAETIKRNAERRPEMKYIAIKMDKPRYGRNYLESYTTFAELGEIWKK